MSQRHRARQHPERHPGVSNRCPLPCGKVQYTSRRQARRLGRARSEGLTMRAYRCPVSGFWHLSSKPQEFWRQGSAA